MTASNLIADEKMPLQIANANQVKAIKVLLPVWGSRYIKQFLDFAVPTFIAPGNLPALTEALPCQLEILTNAEGEELIRSHAAFKRLKEITTTSFRRIDHLITATNYSTTITLAYGEAVRACGKEMLDTCFIFLVSDYIMADGSLKSVFAKIQAGANAVLAGNFQVNAEEGLPWLEDQLKPNAAPLALDCRELMRWSLNHLHAGTLANTVNNPLSHNSHANRLFWRIDKNTLLGRFYLMHMIAIRPEMVNFEIGSSCDYSFVPEMCPSGNIARIADSDEYLVIEMQPEAHEAHFLRPGPMPIGQLAESLNEWTTAGHRENARHTVLFHAEKLPTTISENISLADGFVSNVARVLNPKPQPHRLHRYWREGIAALNEARGHKLSREQRFWLHHLPTARGRSVHMLGKAVFGQAPNVHIWHPRWPDYSNVLSQLAPFISDESKSLLSLSDSTSPFTVMMAAYGDRFSRFQTSMLRKLDVDRYNPFSRQFDFCLLELDQYQLWQSKELLEKLSKLIKPGGTILIVAHCDPSNSAVHAQLSHQAGQLLQSCAWVEEVKFVPTSRARLRIIKFLEYLGSQSMQRPILYMPLAAIFALPLMAATALVNTVAKTKTKSWLAGKGASTLTIAIRVEAEAMSSGAKESTIARTTPSATPNIEPNDTRQSRISNESTREHQYNRCLELKNENGLTELGLMTNQVWHDDPRRLAIVLARYKFVAKMLSGRRDVGELGCGDAFGTRIVLQEVQNVTAYDFDPVFVKDARARQSDSWPFPVIEHDILSKPLPHKHDAIYSLDVIEHISRLQEDTYLVNLCASLESNGVLIIGSPSIQSQAYASPQSKEGHINCKAAPELKALLEEYFHSVFIFSMNDEVVHTGFYPMAHYLFAICSHKKADV